MNILAINAGSSTIKYKVFTCSQQHNSLLLSGLIEGISGLGGNWHHQHIETTTQAHQLINHEQAFAALAQKLTTDLQDYPISRIGHRVVHGGIELFEPTIITEEVLNKIRSLSILAPIHNPINAIGIELAQRYFPNALHVAVFDTGFHHHMPAHVFHYPINSEIAKQYQIQRYGFHGINHEYVAHCAANYLNKPLKTCNFISLHLGNGASACLIKEGKSCDTTMGMTPLAGLVMGTRSGDIDPAIPLYLLRQGLSGEQIDKILNKESGLYGIGGENDMRRLLERASLGDKPAELAIQMFTYSIQKTIGSYLSQIDSLDALIFTGGIGENAWVIREKILKPLKHFNFYLDEQENSARNPANCRLISTKGYSVLVIKGDEESLIAQKVTKI